MEFEGTSIWLFSRWYQDHIFLPRCHLSEILGPQIMSHFWYSYHWKGNEKLLIIINNIMGDLTNVLSFYLSKSCFRIIISLETKHCGLGSRIRDVEAFWYKTEIKIIYFVNCVWLYLNVRFTLTLPEVGGCFLFLF